MTNIKFDKHVNVVKKETVKSIHMNVCMKSLASVGVTLSRN